MIAPSPATSVLRAVLLVLGGAPLAGCAGSGDAPPPHDGTVVVVVPPPSAAATSTEPDPSPSVAPSGAAVATASPTAAPTPSLSPPRIFIGRRPRGGAATAARARWCEPSAQASALGAAERAFLAARWVDAAHDEHLSVSAFEQMAADLGRCGAPAALVREAERAARDEARHAELCAELARGYGSRVALPPRAARVDPRLSRAEVSRENVVEGCVRETFAAVLLGEVARTATAPHARDAVRAIHADEVRHARLAWAWLREEARAGLAAGVDLAFDHAIAELVRGARAGADAPPELDRGALVAHGHLPARRVVELADEAARTLWPTAISALRAA